MKTIDLRINQVFFFLLLLHYRTLNFLAIVRVRALYERKKFKRTGLFVDISQKLDRHGNRLLLILLEILFSYFFISPRFSTFERFPPSVSTRRL